MSVRSGITEKESADAEYMEKIENAKTDQASTTDALAKLAEFIAGLHADCDFLLANFDVRKEARTNEVPRTAPPGPGIVLCLHRVCVLSFRHSITAESATRPRARKVCGSNRCWRSGNSLSYDSQWARRFAVKAECCSHEVEGLKNAKAVLSGASFE